MVLKGMMAPQSAMAFFLNEDTFRRFCKVRTQLHPATATSLPNLTYCFGVVLLHQAFVTATATNFAVTGESLCEPFGSDVTATSQTRRCRWM